MSSRIAITMFAASLVTAGCVAAPVASPPGGSSGGSGGFDRPLPFPGGGSSDPARPDRPLPFPGGGSSDPARPDRPVGSKGGCDAGPAQSVVGRSVDTVDLDRLTRSTGASFVRLLNVGQPTTREFRAGRLNVVIDRARRIDRVYCG